MYEKPQVRYGGHLCIFLVIYCVKNKSDCNKNGLSKYNINVIHIKGKNNEIIF